MSREKYFQEIAAIEKLLNLVVKNKLSVFKFNLNGLLLEGNIYNEVSTPDDIMDIESWKEKQINAILNKYKVDDEE